jgi:hypothetical protein
MARKPRSANHGADTSDEAPCLCSDQAGLRAWAEFAAGELAPRRAPEPGAANDLRDIVEADAWFRGLADGSVRWSRRGMAKRARLIFDHPLKAAYPLLFPEERDSAGEEAALFEAAAASYGLRIGDGARTLFIRNHFGVELLSARIDPEGRLNLWSLRVLGLLPHELLFLDPDRVSLLRAMLPSRFFAGAGALADAELDAAFPVADQPNLRRLARLTRFCSVASTNGCGPEGFDPVPDLAYQACCDAHDTCYARGGTEQDRARCDETLARCIEAVGGGPLSPDGFAVGAIATLYYVFVTLFGSAIFNYGPKGDATTKPDRIAGPPAGHTPQGGDCHWNLMFLHLTISNAPSGGREIQPEIVPDFERQIRTNPGNLSKIRFPEITVDKDGTRRFTSAPLPSKFGVATCGRPVILPVLVKDVRSTIGAQKHIEFICDGSTYAFSITLKIGDMSVAFDFEIRTKCAT